MAGKTERNNPKNKVLCWTIVLNSSLIDSVIWTFITIYNKVARILKIINLLLYTPER